MPSRVAPWDTARWFPAAQLLSVPDRCQPCAARPLANSGESPSALEPGIQIAEHLDTGSIPVSCPTVAEADDKPLRLPTPLQQFGNALPKSPWTRARGH